MNFKRIKNVSEVWISESSIIIFGSLEDPEDRNHHCDHAGCESDGDHVLIRWIIRYPNRFYSPKTQEEDIND